MCKRERRGFVRGEGQSEVTSEGRGTVKRRWGRGDKY